MFKQLTIVAAFAMAIQAAFANSNCDNPRDDFDGLYCLNKVYLQADKELNELYGKLNSKLDSSGKSTLKQGQLAWIDNRNQRCSQRDSAGFWVNLNCATRTTIDRTQFLNDRLRECSSAGCMNSRLR